MILFSNRYETVVSNFWRKIWRKNWLISYSAETYYLMLSLEKINLSGRAADFFAQSFREECSRKKYPRDILYSSYKFIRLHAVIIEISLLTQIQVIFEIVLFAVLFIKYFFDFPRSLHICICISQKIIYTQNS